jgi:glycosyltransferase involved in cell wall biosynthesis
LVDFSVIIPAYNVSGIVGRAIRSAAAQSFPPLEIVVIDDCSTDKTVEVVKALEQEIPSLRLLLMAANGGPGGCAQCRIACRERRLDCTA